MTWQGEALKTAIYLGEGEASPPSALDLWKSVVGTEPDSFQKPPNLGPMASIASGKAGGYTITIVCQISRLEISLQQIDPTPHDATPQPMIQDLGLAIKTIRDHGTSLLKRQKVVRIGAILQLVQDIPDLPHGVAEINRAIGLDAFAPQTRDALIQMNLRTQWQGMDVNRLCRWGTASIGTTLVAVNAGAPAGAPVASSKRDVVFLHIDVNNAPLTEPTEQAKVLFNHLWDTAIGISENGRNALT